jgi:hypothetical protein
VAVALTLNLAAGACTTDQCRMKTSESPKPPAAAERADKAGLKTG